MNEPQTMEDLATLGLEYTRQIDQMLTDLWREFKALKPDYAAPFEEGFGSTKLAALAIASRLGDQASLLEQLARKDLSQEEIDDILQLGLRFVAQLKPDCWNRREGSLPNIRLVPWRHYPRQRIARG